MLPLGPAGEGHSPYRCYSALAGNPLLISPELLHADGLLSASMLRAAALPGGRVDFDRVSVGKTKLLKAAYGEFTVNGDRKLVLEFERFAAAQANWLDDYALFMALRQSLPAASWTQWPKPLAHRDKAAIRSARKDLADEVAFQKFVQFMFFRQLKMLREAAASAGISLIGDLPLFVSPESTEVWTHPKLFQLDKHLRPTAVAGVPPDLFSATGQCWGNPLYNWDEMARDKFSWWKRRLGAALAQADVIRIDHFRGLEAYWRIPAGAATAQSGRWVKAPGTELFTELLKDDPRLPLLAEDLGIITPAVELLRDRFHLPGMRVLQFGFGDDPEDLHSPHNFIRHCFAYTGTHDNDTTASWYRSLPREQKRKLQRYAPNLDWTGDASGSLVRILFASCADHVIVPLQDLLGLGHEARMNTPGRSEGNWAWRLGSFSRCDLAFEWLEELTGVYQRDRRRGQQLK